MNINVAKLSKELTAAGIAIGGCNSNGIVWDVDGVTEIQNLPEVQAVLRVHTPDKTQAEIAAIARKENARQEAGLASRLKSLTPQEAVEYIEVNVTNLASAKAVMKIMARMLIAMRDEVWPELLEE